MLQAGDEYLEAHEAEVALAAVKVVARLQGNWGPKNVYTQVIDTWVEQTRLEVPVIIITEARSVIKRILTTHSELFELWQEAPGFEAWKALVEQPGARVAA